MKKTIIINSLLLLIASQIYAQEIRLIKEIELLKPFMGKTWFSEMEGVSGDGMLHLQCKYEPMHDGRIIKFYSECKELKQQSDGYFYYDPVKDEIAYLILNSNGNYGIGNVKQEGEYILRYGFSTIRGQRIEFRNTFEIKSDREIVDKYYRLEDGEWKAGHSRVWTAK